MFLSYSILMSIYSGGKLFVGYGPMGGGKTKWLINQVRDEDIVFLPSTDTRSHNSLKAHDGSQWGKRVVTIPREKPEAMLKAVNASKLTGKIIIDEVNFFSQGIVEVILQLTSLGYEVMAVGLLLDSDRREFGPTRRLRDLAHRTKRFYAHCDFGVNGDACTKPARYNYFKGMKPNQVVVGAFDLYGSSCEIHYQHFRDVYGLETVPFVRLPRSGNRWPRIEVGADSMRVGKTTAVRVLARGLKALGYPVTAAYEEWQQNPYLKQSYTDPYEHLLESQKWFLHHKYEQVLGASRDSIMVQDLPPEMDYRYAVANQAMGRMRPADFKAYHDYSSQFIWEDVPAPDLLVYLTISDEELIRRATNTARQFEVVDTDYFLALKQTNRRWLAGIKKQWRVLEIDTDTINFARHGKGRDFFVHEVQTWVGR
jgi:thymidine kinase/deoxyadenosine/deoxycytidine kinase